jgi:sulfite exporter TauE/SafE
VIDASAITFGAALAGGLLGSAHCIGMCGPIAAALGTIDVPLRPLVVRHLAYNLGRVFTYAFMGAMAGAAGLWLSQYRLPMIAAQQLFAVVAGVIMLAVGLSVLGLIRLPRTWAVPEIFAPLYRGLLNARSVGGFFLAGLANGFLPCGLVYSFVALAAAGGSVAAGWLLMAAFGLGTLPAMLAVGCGSRLLTHAARLRVYRVAAVLIVLLGGVTVARAFTAPAGACHGAAVDATAGGPGHNCCDSSAR